MPPQFGAFFIVKNHFKKAVKGRLKGRTPVFEHQKTHKQRLWAFPNGGEVKTSFNILIIQNNLQNARFSLIVIPHTAI